MLFEQHCDNLGIQLLREDIEFIKIRLKKVPNVSIKTVLSRYADIWVFEMNTTRDLTKAQNAGRRAANNFLREFTQ
jgi:hypothetical protein